MSGPKYTPFSKFGQPLSFTQNINFRFFSNAHVEITIVTLLYIISMYVEIASPEITSNALGIRLHKDLRLCWSKSCYRVSTNIIFSALYYCIACGAMTNKLLRGFQGIHHYHKFTVSGNYSLQKPIEGYIWLYCEMQDKAKSELIMPLINA